MNGQFFRLLLLRNVFIHPQDSDDVPGLIVKWDFAGSEPFPASIGSRLWFVKIEVGSIALHHRRIITPVEIGNTLTAECWIHGVGPGSASHGRG